MSQGNGLGFTRVEVQPQNLQDLLIVQCLEAMLPWGGTITVTAVDDTVTIRRDRFGVPHITASSDRDAWARLVTTGMRQDWSWARSATKYVELYKKTIGRCRQSSVG